jgi:quercetin dioxygenase-like cupin family protein
MSGFALRLVADRLAAGATATFTAGTNRVLYLAEGYAGVSAGGTTCHLSPGSAWHGRSDVQCRAGAAASLILRFELAMTEDVASREGVQSRVKIQRSVLLDPTQPYLMRCDRVDMPPGSVRHLHCHSGAGIRSLLHGSFRLKRNGESETYAPGEAWFEGIEEPVVAFGSPREITSFVRVLVLPRDYLGRRSSRTIDEGDQAKPQPLSGPVFIDAPIEL